MTSSTPISEAVTRYQENLDRASRDLSNLQDLEALAQTMLEDQEQMPPEQVANFHRATSPGQFPRPGGPTQHGHWAHSYLKFMQDPNCHNAHRCLDEIAGQTQNSMGRHNPQDAALFTAALQMTLEHLPIPGEAGRGKKRQLAEPVEHLPAPGQDERAEQRHLVELAHAVARTQQGGQISQEAWARILQASVPAAAQELRDAFKPEKQGNHPAPGRDHLGRFRYQTRTVRELETAKAILEEALEQNALNEDDPAATEIQDAWDQHHETCRRESTVRCAFNAVPSDPVYAMAQQPRLTPSQAREMALAAQRVILKHQDGNETPRWLEEAATLTPPANRTITQHEVLQTRLQELADKHDSWFDRAVQFDDYGQPGNEEFEQLNREHARHMNRHASMMVAAATITAVHLAERRDAVLVAAAGTINWQARQELEMFQRHTDLSGRYGDQALSRLETAIAIIQCMPDQVLPQEERQLILEKDEQTRDSITKRRK